MSGPRLARVDMDAVAPLTPHDKTAAMVGGKGEHYEFVSKTPHSDTPLPIRKPDVDQLRQPGFVDLSGVSIGRLRVIGIAELRTCNGQNWVVRCVCGNYETRKTKYIKKCRSGDNPGEFEPMCSWCLNTRRLQMGKGSKAAEQKWRQVLEDFPS
jgi:hypothetical protein